MAHFTYRAAVDHIVDGDTVDVTADLGFGIAYDIRLRLAGIDTAEIHFVSKDSEEYEKGMAHKTFVEEWVQTGIDETPDAEWPFIVTTQQDRTGAYGRYIASIVRRSDGSVLNEALVEEFGDSVRY